MLICRVSYPFVTAQYQKETQNTEGKTDSKNHLVGVNRVLYTVESEFSQWQIGPDVVNEGTAKHVAQTEKRLK